MINLTKGKNTTRLQEIKRRHNKSTLLNITINQDSVNNWSVESEHTERQFYKIKQISDVVRVCRAMISFTCKLCIHTLQYTCLDYKIKSTICKHLHFVALKVISTEIYVENTQIQSGGTDDNSEIKVLLRFWEVKTTLICKKN